MPSDSPKDIRNIWQNQPTEPIKVSLDLIRYKAQQRDENARLQTMFSMAIAAGLCLLFTYASARATDGIPRIGWGLLAMWCVYFAYHAYRWMRPRRFDQDATLSTSLGFYRRELERRRDYVTEGFWRAGLPVVFIGLALVIVPPAMRSPDFTRILPNTIPFFSVLVIWALAFVYQRRRTRQKLDEEIEELKMFETERGKDT